MNEFDSALNSYLSADATLLSLAPAGVHEAELPQSAITNRQAGVIFFKMSGLFLYTHQGLFARDLLYQVKGVVPRGSGDLGGQIAAQLLALLNNASIVVAGGRIMLMQATSDLYYLDPPTAGVRYEHNGQMYRVQVAV